MVPDLNHRLQKICFYHFEMYKLQQPLFKFRIVQDKGCFKIFECFRHDYSQYHIIIITVYNHGLVPVPTQDHWPPLGRCVLGCLYVNNSKLYLAARFLFISSVCLWAGVQLWCWAVLLAVSPGLRMRRTTLLITSWPPHR